MTNRIYQIIAIFTKLIFCSRIIISKILMQGEKYEEKYLTFNTN